MSLVCEVTLNCNVVLQSALAASCFLDVGDEDYKMVLAFYFRVDFIALGDERLAAYLLDWRHQKSSHWRSMVFSTAS